MPCLPESIRDGSNAQAGPLNAEPDAAESLRLDPRYAIRVANRDVPWWTDPRGHYGINLLGVVEAAP